MDERFEVILEKNLLLFHDRKLNCAETVLTVMNEYLSLGANCVPRIATPFGGGMCSRQLMCGALTGGLMAIGLVCGRECGGDRMPSYDMGNAFINDMNKRLPGLYCAEIVKADFKDPADRDAFSAPGGEHEQVCEPLVAEICRYLAECLSSR